MADIPNPAENFKEFQGSLFKALVSATTAATSLPADDLGFYRSLDRDFAKDLDQVGSRLLRLSNQLLQHCAKDTGVDASTFEDIDDVTDRFGGAIDVIDSLFEKADVCLDELQGRTRKPNVQVEQATPEVTQISTKSQARKLEYKLLHAKNIVRPQLKFKDRVDNSPNTPFQRKIIFKPHAMVPLDHDFADTETDQDGMQRSLPHPYIYEIQHITYPDHMFEQREPIMYKPFDETSATWVDTEEGLVQMMEKLKGEREIAIDLEHHNYRSYQGFTCLMQLSTREEDFIIDALEVRDKLWMLNEYFADPNIVKLLHGAESDIIWLQRDFGLYIVNLFDTYFATKVLSFPQHGLAYLLKKYCSVDADKAYQLADWRIRPLPEEMLKYARADTHYLLYIYDCLRNELLSQSSGNENLLRSVLQRSAQLAQTKHEKDVYDAETGLGSSGWKNLLEKWRHPMNTQQFAVFKALHRWRDHVAREEDESVRYVLPNHMLFALVERMPTESSGVIGCCNPCPSLVRMNAQAVAMVIQRAKTEALMTGSESAAPSIPTIQPILTKPVSQTVKIERKIDPSLFDLQKVREVREKDAMKLCKLSSALFGDLCDNTVDLSAQKLVESIRSSIKLTLPFEGLKMKPVIPAATAVSGVTAVEVKQKVEEEKEHVFVAAEQRETKRKDREEVIVLKQFSRKKKKQKQTTV
ncbi:exosome nuclease subunit [Apophysomyces ossiformis]|uniref:Exosome nuclease subunit n=1 Tax=Apophysomyces ossiformis TaxID=679940 RepID=A0A8H7BKM4_9FUNG|nr:exosome nuclease subunit [Apophysomyces ossiformis]